MLAITLRIRNEHDKIIAAETIKRFDGVVLAEGMTDEPPLFIADVDGPSDAIVEQAAQLLQAGTVKGVVLVGHNPDPSILLRAMQAGISEFLESPLSKESLEGALRRFLYKNAALTDEGAGTPKGILVALQGVRNGMGTTTVAMNLAWSIATVLRDEVAIVDMARPYGDIPLYLDVKCKYSWLHAGENVNRIDPVYLRSIMEKSRSGLHVLSGPPPFARQASLAPQVLEKLLNTMLRTFKCVVLDLGTPPSDIIMKAMSMADVKLLVLNETLPSMAGAKNLYGMYKAMAPMVSSRLRFLINRHVPGNAFISKADIEDVVSAKMDFFVRNDYKSALKAMHSGSLIKDIATKSPIEEDLDAVASMFFTHDEEKQGKQGLMSFFKRLPSWT